MAFITVDMTYPATEKHISKCREQAYHMVRLTNADVLHLLSHEKGHLVLSGYLTFDFTGFSVLTM